MLWEQVYIWENYFILCDLLDREGVNFAQSDYFWTPAAALSVPPAPSLSK